MFDWLKCKEVPAKQEPALPTLEELNAKQQRARSEIFALCVDPLLKKMVQDLFQSPSPIQTGSFNALYRIKQGDIQVRFKAPVPYVYSEGIDDAVYNNAVHNLIKIIVGYESQILEEYIPLFGDLNSAQGDHRRRLLQDIEKIDHYFTYLFDAIHRTKENFSMFATKASVPEKGDK